MSATKKAGWFLGMALGLLAVLVIFGNYIGSSAPTVTDSSHPDPSQRAGGRILKDSSVAFLPQNDEVDAVPLAAPRNDEINSISEKITATIKELNPEGPVEFNNEKVIRALNPDKIASEVIVDELAKIETINLGLDTINLNDIKTSSDNSSVAIKKYLSAFQNILINNFQSITNVDLDALIAAHQKSIADFYQLVAPSNLADVHKQEILLLSQQLAIFENINNADNDPITALAALKKKSDVENGFAELNKTVRQIIANNNFEI